MSDLEHPQEEKKGRLTKAHKKALGVTFFCISLLVLAILLLVSVNVALRMTFDGRIYRNVVIAGVPVGGMDKATATEALENLYTHMIGDGLVVGLYDESRIVSLSPQGATDPDLVYPLIDADINSAVDTAYATGRNGNTIAAFFGPLWYTALGRKEVTPTVTVAETKLAEAIRTTFPEAEAPGSPTDFVITGTKAPYLTTVTTAVPGATLDLESAFLALENDAKDFHLQPLNLSLKERSAIISKEEAETLIPAVETALEGGPYTLTFTNEFQLRSTFPVPTENLKTWLLPVKDEAGNPTLTVDAQAMKEFMDGIHAKIDISAHDAIFETDGARVTKFEPGRDGLRVDDDALIRSLSAAFMNGTKDIAISAMVTEPDITTAESNSLGIQEVLGVGTSNYGVSSSNRIANIKHGASKLNGLLVAPGETLSLLEHLQPFTTQDGYFPELVIKGDEIKPEVGGGLCQIGTTTFRAVMNSGLKVIERRNHSLVVSHYNDPSNGNPGTDATIYDPSPDFKFENDTGADVLLITDVNTTTHELTFTFWGTSDGRKGSYVPPTVLSRSYPSKETKIILTPDLAPGKQSCEPAFNGATTTFDYNITNPDGTITTQTFTSTYRALQKVCLQGIDPNAGAPAPTTPVDPNAEPIPVE